MSPPLARHELVNRHCRPREGKDAMTAQAVSSQLALLSPWRLEGESIVRTYDFANYYQTIAFVNALAWVVHREDHHPELTVAYNRCSVRFDTHSIGGISENDFVCAAKSDAIFDTGNRHST